MSFVISFPGNAFSGIADAYEFGDRYSLFEKTAILWDNKRGYIDYDGNVIDALVQNRRRNYNLLEQYSATFEFGSTVTFRYEQHRWLHIFYFRVADETELDMAGLLQDAERRNFSFAYKADTLKFRWQNEILPGNYETIGRGRPHHHLPKRWDSDLSPVLGEFIDISVNPGHSIETYSMSLMAAPEMWFGPYSWNYFDPRKVASFIGAAEIKELTPEIMYVKLFDGGIPDYEVPEVLKLQKDFRDWTGMDSVERMLQDRTTNE